MFAALPPLPAECGLPIALLCMLGFAVAVGAIFYLINQMKP